jgi:hypothetical protein
MFSRRRPAAACRCSRIYFDVGAMKIAESDRLGGVTIFYGIDEQAMAKTLREFIGPGTEVIAVPRGDERPQ